MFTGYAWNVPDAAALTITTKMTIDTGGGNLYYAGTVDHIDPTSGSSGGACANRYSATVGVRAFGYVNVIDGSSPGTAPWPAPSSWKVRHTRSRSSA